MSNFFTRSKDDMKYLFKNKEELSKKERKRKRRGWGTLIGLILVLIQLIVSGLLLFNILKLDILPLKYLIAVNAFLLLIFLYDFTSQLNYKQTCNWQDHLKRKPCHLPVQLHQRCQC